MKHFALACLLGLFSLNAFAEYGDGGGPVRPGCITLEQAEKLLPKATQPLCDREPKDGGRIYKLSCHCDETFGEPLVTPSGYKFPGCTFSGDRIDQNAESFTKILGYKITCEGTVERFREEY